MQKLPSMAVDGVLPTDSGAPEPRALFQMKGTTKVVHPRNGGRSKLPLRAREVLKPLDASEDDGVGIAITAFEEGWDLPPGIRDPAAESECENGFGDDGIAEDRLLGVRFGECDDGVSPQVDPLFESEDDEGYELTALSRGSRRS
jgi:hypothetical protein